MLLWVAEQGVLEVQTPTILLHCYFFVNKYIIFKSFLSA